MSTRKKSGSTKELLGRETRRLPVELTEAELLERGLRLAVCEQRMSEFEAQYESLKREMKAKESAILSERAMLAGVLRDKAELRDVETETWSLPESGVVRCVRLDTGATVEERKMSLDEMQRGLFEPVPPPRLTDLAETVVPEDD